MGCCGSKSDVAKTDSNKTGENNTDETLQLDAKKQRRRLSVAPGQVGDISKFRNNRRSSNVDESHIPAQDPKKFVAISKKGHVPYNKNKVNQDAYFCDFNFDGCSNVRLFGVCDGHGEYGHHVANLVAKKIPKYLKSYDYGNDPVKAIKDTVAKVAQILKKSNVNSTFSGTTMVFSLIVDDQIYTANLGDSRAIIISVGEANSIAAKALSYDHKPDLPAEEERIIASGGRVAPLPGIIGDDCGPNRVWLADIDVPGLAMSRSIGDDVAHSVGVSHVPEITIHKIRETDSFMVFASDGVWEFIRNEEVAAIVYKRLPDLRAAALKLVKESIMRWRDEEEVIDDITAIIYNLQQIEIKGKDKELEPLQEDAVQLQDTKPDLNAVAEVKENKNANENENASQNNITDKENESLSNAKVTNRNESKSNEEKLEPQSEEEQNKT